MVVWNVLDKNNLPFGEVLCANFSVLTCGFRKKLVGTVRYCEEIDKLVCNSINDDVMLENVTHYVDIHSNDIIDGMICE